MRIKRSYVEQPMNDIASFLIVTGYLTCPEKWLGAEKDR